MKAPLPANEAARLEALYHLDILDTAPEVSFDRIAQATRRMLDVPIALVSLIDRDRQWFKACFGMAVGETSRDVAFCAHAILLDTVMAVPDATLDIRFAENPLVTGPPHIRAYAGAPLRTPEGYNIGTLCVIDTVPREYSPDQLAILSDLAAVTSELVQSRLLAARLAESERRKAAILEASLDSVITVDHEDRIIEFNPAAESTFRCTKEEALGCDLLDLIARPSVRPFYRGLFRRLNARRSVPFTGKHVETIAVRADGSHPPEILCAEIIAALALPSPRG